jgi:hypothetical protein
MKKVLIAILCLSVGLAGGFAGYRGHRVWKQNRCQIINAKSGDSSRISGIWENASTVVPRVLPFAAEEDRPNEEAAGEGRLKRRGLCANPALREPAFEALCQSNLDGAFWCPQQLREDANSVFNNRRLHLCVLHASAHSGQQRFPGALELQSPLNPAQTDAPPASELTSFLTGAGTLGLLLFGAAIHPRRFTVLWIGR